jgi:hypothetical protein
MYQPYSQKLAEIKNMDFLMEEFRAKMKDINKFGPEISKNSGFNKIVEMKRKLRHASEVLDRVMNVKK